MPGEADTWIHPADHGPRSFYPGADVVVASVQMHAGVKSLLRTGRIGDVARELVRQLGQLARASGTSQTELVGR
jgi:hypothetical protein